MQRLPRDVRGYDAKALRRTPLRFVTPCRMFQGAHVIVGVYAVDDRKSLAELERHVVDARKHTRDDALLTVLGNKTGERISKACIAKAVRHLPGCRDAT